MAENATNRRLLRALRDYHCIRVENSCFAGTPDINFTGGWIESKWVARWPRKGTILRLRHFTPQQRVWHTLRCLKGGVSYVFLQVGYDYLLFRGDDAARELGKLDEEGLNALALARWNGSLNDKELIACLVTE